MKSKDEKLAYIKQYRLTHKTEIAITAKAYRDAHKEESIQYNKEYRAKMPVEKKEAYEKNRLITMTREYRDVRNAKQRTVYPTIKAKVRARNKIWDNNNKQKMSGYKKQWAIDNPDKVKSNTLFGRYRISLEDYNNMLLAQKGKCPICLNDLKTPVVDHNHSLNKVRAIICHKCNLAIGLFNDDISILQSAIQYLINHS